MLGKREPALYGTQDYPALVRYIKDSAKELGVKVRLVQSNDEGAIVTAIQKAWVRYDGIVINAGAYTHTSVAILDALKAVALPTVEVHLTDIATREEFRHISYVSLWAEAVFKGEGFEGYKHALEHLAKRPTRGANA